MEELYAAPGAFTAWTITDFDLVGDTANGGLQASVPGTVGTPLLNVVGIASCSQNETRREDSALGHSFFMNYLLEAMSSKLTDADPAPPYSSTGGPGTAPGFNVSFYKATSSSARRISAAWRLSSAPRVLQAYTASEIAPYVNYDGNNGNASHFYAGAAAPGNIANRPFPSLGMGAEVDYLATRALATLTIPTLDNYVGYSTATFNISSGQAGLWTFGVNTAQGFNLTLYSGTGTGGPVVGTIASDTAHPAGDTLMNNSAPA